MARVSFWSCPLPHPSGPGGVPRLTTSAVASVDSIGRRADAYWQVASSNCPGKRSRRRRCLVGERELCVGAGLERFKLAQRRRERCLASRVPLSRRISSPLRPYWRPPRPRERASRHAPEQPRRPPHSARIAPGGKLNWGRVVWRDDHPHPDPRLVEQFLRKVVGHPHAPIRQSYSANGPKPSSRAKFSQGSWDATANRVATV